MVAKNAAGGAKILDIGPGMGTFSGSVPVPLEQIICVEPDRKSRGTPVEKGCTVFE